jgi:hypothetical protein
MTGTDLARRRTELGLTHDQVGEWLNEHADQIKAWETIPGPLPGGLAKRLDWALASEGRERELEAAGHPVCSEAKRILGTPIAHGVDSQLARYKLAQAHGATCPHCQARLAAIQKLPPLPPFPLSPWVSFLAKVTLHVQRLPAALRPAAWGALMMGALTLIKVVLQLLLSPRSISPQLAVFVLEAIGLGAYGGAVGGAAYTLVRPRVRHLGRPGDYLTGLACSYAFFLAFGLPVALFTDDRTLHDPLSWGVFFIFATVAGLAIGRSWFKSDASTPLSGV